MRVGLTYDLRSEYLALGYSEDETAEFDRDETVQAVEASIRRLGHATERIGNVFRLAFSYLNIPRKDIPHETTLLVAR